MEYWSVENNDIDPFGTTPTLHHSSTPKIIKFKNSLEELPAFR
jgi:hypothetical protein